MHITYDLKNDIEYAKLCTSKRMGKKVNKDYTYLGRVLDREKGIYQNRERGVFTFSIENGYGKAPAEFVADVSSSMGKMKLILDFGDSFFIDEFLKQNGLIKVVEEIGYVRLIYVTQQDTGMPIYFRYCPGNVVDTTTLTRTMAELKESGINTKFAILDAGYYTDDNIRELYKNQVSFITRLRENRILYKELVAQHLPGIEDANNFVSYNGRYVYVKCVPCKLVDDYKGYASICLDIERKSMESHKLFQRATENKLSDKDVYDKMQDQGVFVLVASRRIAKPKILPAYYMRQQIEQIFDIGKNYADMLPIRVQTEDTFRGHLLLTFMATVVCKLVQDKLLKKPINPISLFLNLRNHKCKVYNSAIITQEEFKKANDCYKLFNIKCPVRIPIQ